MTGAGFSLEEWQIRLVLPHRPPVLQLDRIDHCVPTLDRLEASKALAGGDAMLMRRAGGAPVMAPAALIEALAQCCGLLLRLRWLAADGADLVSFAAGDDSQVRYRAIPRSVLAESQARFSERPAPGRIVRLAARLVLSRGEMHRFDAVAQGATQAASVQIMLNFPRFSPGRSE